MIKKPIITIGFTEKGMPSSIVDGIEIAKLSLQEVNIFRIMITTGIWMFEDKVVKEKKKILKNKLRGRKYLEK